MEGPYVFQRREDGSAIIPYDFSDFFVHIHTGTLPGPLGRSTEAHWHEDIELVSVLTGRMQYNINGSIERLSAGEGILINSRQMHNAFSDNGAPCEYLCALLHPMYLCISHKTERDLVAPLLSDPSLPYALLRGDEPWKQDILSAICEMYACKDTPAATLRIESLFCKIWVMVYENMEHCRKGFRSKTMQNKNLNTLKTIVSYIHTHYREKITLDDLAKAGYISKSHCLNLFRQHLNDSPINYLISYRLKLSMELLARTDMTIASIAYQVGFSSSSFFVDRFHKVYGCTPMEYRRVHRGGPQEEERLLQPLDIKK